MPVCSFVAIAPHSAYVVWHITESVAQLREAATPLPPALTHPQRQKTCLAARLALRALLTRWGIPEHTLQKDRWGRPHLAGVDLHLSLTHSAAFACAAVSRQGPIGIDIQLPQARLRRVKQKFLNASELQVATDDLAQLCAYWCAKEAIYKAVGGQGLSLQQDVHIQPLTRDRQGAFRGTARQQLFVGQYGFVADHVLAWCVRAPDKAADTEKFVW